MGFHSDKGHHAYTFESRGNVALLIYSLKKNVQLFLVEGRKPEKQEETHVDVRERMKHCTDTRQLLGSNQQPSS